MQPGDEVLVSVHRGEDRAGIIREADGRLWIAHGRAGALHAITALDGLEPAQIGGPGWTAVGGVLCATTTVRARNALVSRNVGVHSERQDSLADKQAAKLRRRDNREQREREKAARTGDSPAQKAEQTRRRDEASADSKSKNQREERDAD